MDQLLVSYCEGWDAGGRRAVGPLSAARAEERDRDGEQYTVLLSLGERPTATIDVAWTEHYCAVWLFDERLRRRYQAEFRRLAQDRMFLAHARRWDYGDDAQAEFDERAVTRTVTISLDGRMTIEDRPEGRCGGLAVTNQNVSPEDCWDVVPVFGEWRRLVETVFRAIGYDAAPDLVLHDASDPQGQGLSADERPWRPPRPLRPAPLEPMFAKGTRYRLEHGAEVVVETRQAGALRMTSGMPAAADPGWLRPDVAPFTAAVAAGEYPVELSLIRFAAEPGHRRVAAARLTVRDEPVASWELALRPDQDPRLLGDGEFFGFGVDAGMGCFVDAEAAEALADIVEETYEDAFEDLLSDQAVEVSDPATGANLIAFPSGWGDGAYPTWIGRTTDGEVACFVADMLVLHTATMLS
ncbi:DUF4241 domain-containing protein [Actinoallomurus oryzae]|uniref:DUF4241 domain-containing protein n=1 Tax=Actinoallomurus oryzae TaxID=502180 RepID=UPI0031EA6698